MTIYTDPEENEDYRLMFPPHGHRPPEIRYPRPHHPPHRDHPLVVTSLGMGPRGEPGEPGAPGETFTFDDLTQEQLEELRADVASVYHTKLEYNFTTTSLQPTSRIPIPWWSWLDMSKTMLFVMVEGLLLRNNEYSVTDDYHYVVLNTPISHRGTVVSLIAITTIAMTVEDLENLAGEDGFSPVATVERAGRDRAKITITDRNGTTEAFVYDGPAGVHGPTGPVGPAGPQGPKGDAGPAGPAGPKGQKGDKGDKGDTGLQGPKGDTGDRGPQGVTGPTGPQGERGPQGESALVIDVWNAEMIIHCDPDGNVSPDFYAHNVFFTAWRGTQRIPCTIDSWRDVGNFDVSITRQATADNYGILNLWVPYGEKPFDVIRPYGAITLVLTVDGSHFNEYINWTTVNEGPKGDKGDTGEPAEPDSITDAMLAPDGIKAEVEWLWGNQLTGELSGELMQASDAYGAPVLSLGVDGKSTQDGTPTPDAPVEIKSVDDLTLHVCGKNLLPSNRFCRTTYNPSAGAAFNPESGAPSGTVTDNGDGTFTMEASAGWQSAAFYTDVLPVGEYHLKVAFAGSTPRISIGFVDPDTMTYIGTAEPYTSSGTVNKTYNFAEDRIVVVFVASSSAGTVTITQPQLELGSTATEYEPYICTTVTLPVTLRGLPDGTHDTLALSYLKPSTREGWAWYTPTLTALVGETTTAATDGITGTVGVDVMSTTGEIADGPTVLYKLATPATTTLGPIELPVLPAPDVTVWADPTTGLAMEYVRDANLVIAAFEAALADLATS